MSAENANKIFVKHPLWVEYQTATSLMREFRENNDINDKAVSRQIDLLEERVTDLATRIAKESGIQNEHFDNHLWFVWDEKWKRLRESRDLGRFEDEETIWEEIQEIGELINKQRLSKN